MWVYENRNVEFQSEILFGDFWFRCVALIYTVIHKYMPCLEWPRTSAMKEARLRRYVQIIIMASLEARGIKMSVFTRCKAVLVIKQSGGGSGGKTPYIVDLCIRWRRMVSSTSRQIYPQEKQPPASTAYEARWNPGPVWKLWKHILPLPGMQLIRIFFAGRQPDVISDCGTMPWVRFHAWL